MIIEYLKEFLKENKKLKEQLEYQQKTEAEINRQSLKLIFKQREIIEFLFQKAKYNLTLSDMDKIYNMKYYVEFEDGAAVELRNA